MALQIVILAAGKGNRMASETSKVLHKVGGLAMLERVVHVARQLKPKSIQVIYGNGGEHVRQSMSHLPVSWVLQKQQLGTGHAVRKALPKVATSDRVLVLYGDVPLITAQVLEHLLEHTPLNGVGLMVTEVVDPTGFGRIIRNEVGAVEAIVEHRDATDEQRLICEINTGILTTSGQHLKQWLPKLKNKNKQKEYYLTDIAALAVEEGVAVGGVMVDSSQVQGVNDLWQLATVEKHYQKSVAMQLALSGVTLLDWPSLQVRGNDYKIAKEVMIDRGVVIEGQVNISKHVKIGANVQLKDVDIGEGTEILAGSIIEGAKIGKHAVIGPYARIRPGTSIADEVRIGNFVEVKNSKINKATKAGHLSYIGDSVIGQNVNIGAGTIVCNYDGANKHVTDIADHVFIGSNTALVAPLKVGRGATIGAGSTITQDVPPNQLSLSRSEQVSLKNWVRPKKKKK